MNSIQSDDLSIIVEGPIIENITNSCINSLRRVFPKAEIIISTWDTSNTEELDYSILKQSKIVKTNENVHFDITKKLGCYFMLVMNGLNYVSRKYCLKFRTNLVVSDDKFLDYFFKFTSRNENYKFFKNRIVVPSIKNQGIMSENFDPFLNQNSDRWFFGETEDIITYFNLVSSISHPELLQSDESKLEFGSFVTFELSYKRYYFNFLFLRYLFSLTDLNQVNIEQSNLALINNFVFLDGKMHGISLLEKSNLTHQNDIYEKKEIKQLDYNFFTYNYKKYCDHNYIKGIIITSDFLRIGDEENPYFFKSTIEWIYNLFNYQIKITSNYSPIILTGEPNSLINRDYLYELNNLPVSEQSWISLSLYETWTQKAKAYIDEKLSGYLLIIHHANFAFLKILEELNIDYIDIFESSFRFAEDLIFSFRTNNNKIKDILLQYELPKSNLYLLANYVKAYYQRRNSIKILPNSILYVGQTSIDSSLLKDGKMVSLKDYEDDLSKIFSDYEFIYYKPHPFATNYSDEIRLLQKYGDVIETDENIYNLISNENILAVAGLSSGALAEAEFFDKIVYQISHKYIEYFNEENNESYYPKFILVNNNYFSPLFWKNVLSPIVENTNVVSDFFFRNCNILRSSLNCYWGYDLNFTPNASRFEKMYIELNRKYELLLKHYEFLEREIKEIPLEANKSKNEKSLFYKVISFFQKKI